MTGKHWIFLILVIVNAVWYTALVGRPRKAIKPSEAAFSSIEWALLVWLALS